MLSGGFGDDVTDVNESPLRSGRDEIHRVPVEIPFLAPPEPPVYPAQPCLESRRCIAQGAWGQHLLKCLIQISCPPPCSTGIPGETDSSCVAPSFSSSGLSFCPFMLPLQHGHLCVPAPRYTLSSNLLQLRFLPLLSPTVSHFILCRAG